VANYEFLRCIAEKMECDFFALETNPEFDRIITVIDVGQVQSTMLVSSALSGTLFLDGRPGSVKAFVHGNDLCTTIKTRDANSDFANALVFACAFAFSGIIVLPIGGPIDSIARQMSIAFERASELLMHPYDIVLDLLNNTNSDFKLLILYGQEELQPDAQDYAANVIKGIFGRWKTDPWDCVVYAKGITDVIRWVEECPRNTKSGKKKSQFVNFRKAVGIFGGINDYADYFNMGLAKGSGCTRKNPLN
jgi:hypothetical protein